MGAPDARLGDEEVGKLLHYLSLGATWAQLAEDEECEEASLRDAVQEWEPGAQVLIRGGVARVVYPPASLDLDALREAVEAGCSDEEIAARYGTRASTVRRRRIEHGIKRPSASPDRSAPAKAPRVQPEPKDAPEGLYAWLKGDGGEVMRGCVAFEEKMRAEREAQVMSAVSIPCAGCRRPTSITDLRGRPGRLICTACEALDASTTTQGAAAPQMKEEDMGKAATEEERNARRERVLEMILEGVHQAEIARRLGTGKSVISKDVRWLEEQGLDLPPCSVRSKTGALSEIENLRAENERLRNTLRETEEGAAELLGELEQLRALPAANVDARAALASAQREIEALRAQLAAAEEAARRPPEARRAEVERLELEIEALRRREVELELEIKSNSEAAIARLEEAEERRLTLVRALEAARLEAEGLRAQLAVNPYRRAWDALTAYNHAQVSLERARERAAEAAAELEDAEAALLPWSALNGAEVPQ